MLSLRRILPTSLSPIAATTCGGTSSWRLWLPLVACNYNATSTTATSCCAAAVPGLQQQQQQHQQQQRWYRTRAHPQPRVEYPIPDALSQILSNVEQRRQERIKKAERLVALAAKQPDKPARTLKHPDETIELCINLNLDPRKPGQALRGSVTLPHGTGRKSVQCIVFTSDEETIRRSKELGAVHAGGEALIEQIVSGEINIDTVSSSVATSDMIAILNKKGAARILGPRGLMPNVKVGTLVPTTADLILALETQLTGKEISYRTEKEGIVHVPVGKDSFGTTKLLENIGAVMQVVVDAKPDSYGKGKTKKKSNTKKGQAKSTKQPKYILRASLSSTQGPGVRIDLRTIDPASAFFLTGVDPLQANTTTTATSNAKTTTTTTMSPIAPTPTNQNTSIHTPPPPTDAPQNQITV